MLRSEEGDSYKQQAADTSPGSGSNQHDDKVRIRRPKVLIVPKLERCLFLVLAAKRGDISTFMGSRPHLLAGGKHIPLGEVKSLFVLHVDIIGGGSEASILALTWHIRLQAA